MITANEELLNASVRHQVSLSRLATGEVRELVTLFNETQQNIVTKLANKEITEFSRKRHPWHS
jgi:hypothetical protein